MRILRHVDGDLGAAGGDDHRRAQEVHLHRDVRGRGTVVVAHLDLNRSGTNSLSGFKPYPGRGFKCHRFNGPYCDVKGEAWFEVLLYVFEG